MAAPVRIEPVIALDRALDPQFDTVRRLGMIARGEEIPIVRDIRLERLVTALRVRDARAEGASLRQIVDVLLGKGIWPGDGEWAKSWARRLVALAGTLKSARPRAVLERSI